MVIVIVTFVKQCSRDKRPKRQVRWVGQRWSREDLLPEISQRRDQKVETKGRDQGKEARVRRPKKEGEREDTIKRRSDRGDKESIVLYCL